jgi:hypothetical protein
MKKYNTIQRYLNDIFEDDRQNTILESYGDITKDYMYLGLREEKRQEYFEKIVLNDLYFLDYVLENLLNDSDEMTEDEIAYAQYELGKIDYEDYLAVCEIEECEPLQR